MDIMELGAIGELVGGVAVIGSLLYVGLQVRQNTKMEGAASHRAILEEVSRYHQAVMLIPEVVQGGFSDFESLPHRDKLVFAGFMQPQITWFESVVHLHRKDLLDPVIFRAARDYVLTMILSPGGGRWRKSSTTHAFATP